MRVDDFASTVNDESVVAVIRGVRHHMELDERSHNSWRNGGGYAYERQTSALRDAVQSACSVDDELARTLAHNFIETAVDLYVLSKKPELLGRLQSTLASYDCEPISLALAQWIDSDAKVVAARISEFFGVMCRHDLATIDGMVELWAELLDVLHMTTFDIADAKPLEKTHARKAIELALEIVEPEALEVTTP